MLKRDTSFEYGQQADPSPLRLDSNPMPRATTTVRTAHITVRGDRFVSHDLDEGRPETRAIPGAMVRSAKDTVRIDVVLTHEQQLYDVLERLRDLGTTLVGLYVDVPPPDPEH